MKAMVWAATSLALVVACSSTQESASTDAGPANHTPGSVDSGANAGSRDAGLVSTNDEGPQADAGDAAAGALSGTWERLSPLPELPRYYVGVAGVRGQVFVVAGLSDGPEVFAVHAYDVATDHWERLHDLPTAMPMPNVAAVGDRLFVLGARNVSDTFEYDFAADDWLPRAPLPVTNGPGAAAVGVQGTTVFVAGGVLPGRSANLLNTGVRVDSLYAYDSENDTWETLPKLPIAVGYCMGGVLDGQLWVIGGSDNTARTDRVTAFDIATRKWSAKPALPISISSAAAAVLQGRIYLAGGIASSSGVISGLTYFFNPQSDSWEEAVVMPTPRFGMGAGVVDGKMYVPTGIQGKSPTEFVPVGDLEVFSP